MISKAKRLLAPAPDSSVLSNLSSNSLSIKAKKLFSPKTLPYNFRWFIKDLWARERRQNQSITAQNQNCQTGNPAAFSGLDGASAIPLNLTHFLSQNLTVYNQSYKKPSSLLFQRSGTDEQIESVSPKGNHKHMVWIPGGEGSDHSLYWTLCLFESCQQCDLLNRVVYTVSWFMVRRLGSVCAEETTEGLEPISPCE